MVKMHNCVDVTISSVSTNAVQPTTSQHKRSASGPILSSPKRPDIRPTPYELPIRNILANIPTGAGVQHKTDLNGK
jgi:hypothetical protein